MSIVIGIDVGGSTTKIAGIKNNEIIKPMLITANDPLASLFGALGKYLYDNNIGLDEIEKIMLTGVGSQNVSQPLYGLQTATADEFLANGLGGSYLSGLEEVVVVSMGTGTSFVKVSKNEIAHTGGVAVGGGTIIGLSKLLLDTQDINQIIDLANKGDLGNVNLRICDISTKPLPDLPMDVTASSFGKVHNSISKEDIATGIIDMVLQATIKSALLSAINSNITDFVLIGNLTKLPQCKETAKNFGKLFGTNIVIPEHAEYATAIGVARAYIEGKTIKEIK